MLNVKDVLKGVEYEIVSGNHLEVNEIQYDSRKIKNDDMFFAISGFKLDGHDYVEKAIDNGAKVIIIEKNIPYKEGITYVKVENSRKALAKAASNFYGCPSEKMKVIGITGTNGKTTSAFMMKAILEEAGYKVGLIGTIANYIGSKKIDTDKTTPESLELHELFSRMVEEGVDYCVMEVSSHSLELSRVYGIEFQEGIFTNLTQDHLDFHETFENYFNAKAKLFTQSKIAIINIDDGYGMKLMNKLCGKVLSYSINKPGDLKGKNIKLMGNGVEFEIECNGDEYKASLSIPGMYNVYNALGCFGAAINENIDADVIIKGLKNVIVPGRCENVGNGLDFDIILDYSHTPDSLENILKNMRVLTEGRLICVFGCGGDRDKTKRPIMGKIGSELSDLAIITSDNPRSENPQEIIKDIISGVETHNYEIVENRRDAIKRAMSIAVKGDVIVVAGKGHETYQILNSGTIHFDEREIVNELIKELKL